MKYLISILFLFLFATNCFSTLNYWTNALGDNVITSGGNWSLGSITAASDTLIFDGAYSNANATTTTANLTAVRLVFQNGYSGTITQTTSFTFSKGVYIDAPCIINGNANIICNSGSFELKQGTYNHILGIVNIGSSDTTTYFKVSGGTYNGTGVTSSNTFNSFIMTSGVYNDDATTTTIKRNFTLSGGSFNCDAGRFTFNFSSVTGSKSQTITGNPTFYNLTLTAFNSGDFNYNINIADTCTVLNDLIISNGTGANTNRNIIINGGKVKVNGSLSATISATTTGQSSGGTATIEFVGSGTNSITTTGAPNYLKLPNMIINKTGGTLTMAQNFALAGNFEYKQGVVTASNTIYFYGNSNLDGQGISSEIGFSSVDIMSGNVTLTGNLTVNGILDIAPSSSLICSNKTVTCYGNINRNGVLGYGTSTFLFKGTSSIEGTGTDPNNFYNITLDGVSLTNNVCPITILHTFSQLSGVYVDNCTPKVLSFFTLGNKQLLFKNKVLTK